MQIGEPLPSQYDWRFRIFGFPVRVTWLFWAVAAALGFGRSEGFATHAARLNLPGTMGGFLIIWVLVVFVSILVHELGHALAFRYFRIQAEIVLYHMGGLAIPGSGYLWGRQGRTHRLTHWDQIIIAASGPAAQLLLGAMVAGIATAYGMYIPEVTQLTKFLGIELSKQTLPSSLYLVALVHFNTTVSVWWAVFNLIPILPLDGGHIVEHSVGLATRRDGRYEACCVSVILSVAIAFWIYRSGGSPINALFVLALGFHNLQTLQSLNGPRFW